MGSVGSVRRPTFCCSLERLTGLAYRPAAALVSRPSLLDVPVGEDQGADQRGAGSWAGPNLWRSAWVYVIAQIIGALAAAAVYPAIAIFGRGRVPDEVPSLTGAA
jgi:glycerol uptake facilitator-like aquaporin